MLPPLRTFHKSKREKTSFNRSFSGFFPRRTNAKWMASSEHFFKGDLVYADMLVKELNPVFDY